MTASGEFFRWKYCSIDGCGAVHEARGLCKKHYTRWRNHGDPLVVQVPGTYPRKSAEERFWAKVQKTGSCWLWLGALDNSGYGKFAKAQHGSMRQHIGAHRFAYEYLVGPIPAGLVLDHLCRVPECVNPAHLEPVTTSVNLKRAHAIRANGRCPNGHLLVPNNCLRCDRLRRDRRPQHQKAQKSA